MAKISPGEICGLWQDDARLQLVIEVCRRKEAFGQASRLYVHSLSASPRVRLCLRARAPKPTDEAPLTRDMCVRCLLIFYLILALQRLNKL